MFEHVKSRDQVNIISHHFFDTSTELKPTFIRNVRKELNGTTIKIDIDYNTEN